MAGCFRKRNISTTAELILSFLRIVCSRSITLSFPMINLLSAIRSISRRKDVAGDRILKKKFTSYSFAGKTHLKKAQSFSKTYLHKLFRELRSLKMNRKRTGTMFSVESKDHDPTTRTSHGCVTYKRKRNFFSISFLSERLRNQYL